MGLLDSIIFKDKKFSDLLEEIYDLQQQKNSQVTALIQECHMSIYHTLCEVIELSYKK